MIVSEGEGVDRMQNVVVTDFQTLARLGTTGLGVKEVLRLARGAEGNVPSHEGRCFRLSLAMRQRWATLLMGTKTLDPSQVCVHCADAVQGTPQTRLTNKIRFAVEQLRTVTGEDT